MIVTKLTELLGAIRLPVPIFRLSVQSSRIHIIVEWRTFISIESRFIHFIEVSNEIILKIK